MSAIRDAKQVAIVGSPSSNDAITLDILDSAIHEGLVGSMLFLTAPLSGGEELAIGTVTGVTTTNQWHQNPAMRGVIKTHGLIPNMSGDSGDVRAATIKLQAVYGKKPGNDDWVQSGPSLRMSPPTGAPIRTVTNEVLTELMAGEDDLHYLGHLHRTDVRVPMSIRDFSGDRGAFHQVFCGISGSGKSAAACYAFAGQMRHRDHGMIIIDPQGQWASETGLPFSLQAWAAEMGREVIVRRVSEDLRLEKDAPLFGELLSKTRFLRELMKMSAETQEIITDELVKILRVTPDWTEQGSTDLMDTLLRGLREPDVLRRVYADKTRQERLMLALSEVLGDLPDEGPDGEPIVPGTFRLPTPQVLATRQKDVLTQFTPLHNLFARTNPNGGTRHSLWATISHVFDKDARRGAPAPLLILDMSTSGGISWAKDALADDDQRDAIEAIKILDQDAIKAAILRNACRTLKTASEAAFREGETLNTQVVFDEAWRYAPPPSQATDPEIKALSTDLAGYARDTRKFGIGWTMITQSARSLSPDIWDQTTVRVIGYGLGGADLAKVGEQLDDADHLKLYKGFAPPDSTKPKVYPFMITGPVSPLSFSKAPLYLSVFTDFTDFRECNAEWIEANRLAQGKPVLTGTPTRPGARTVAPAPRRAPVVGTGRVPAATARQVEQIRAHRETGGVDTAILTGLSSDSSFSSGLSAIDDDFTEPPF